MALLGDGGSYLCETEGRRFIESGVKVLTYEVIFDLGSGMNTEFALVLSLIFKVKFRGLSSNWLLRWRI